MTGTRLAPLLPALRAAGFVAAAAVVVAMGVRAGADLQPGHLTWWPLPLALAAAVGWWLSLARGWALLVTGRVAAANVSAWCRTQTLRYLPGGFWAPASRVTVLSGGWMDRFSTVAAENVLALCAALAIGGVALAASGAWWWLPLVLALAVPAVAPRFVAGRTRLQPERTRRATVNYLFGFLLYALAAVLVQAAVSGFREPAAVAGAAAVAWAAGLVVVFAPGGVGVRELAYVGLLAHTLPAGQLAAGAVTARVVTIVAELAVLVTAGRPVRDRSAARGLLASTLRFARTHALFLVLLTAGAALRAIALVAYRPALIYWDSTGYLGLAKHLAPDVTHPLGYPAFLRALQLIDPGLAPVPVVQHVMGLVIGVLIYALLVRLGVWRWAAALAAAPALLDAYLINLEQYVLTETLFDLLVVAACVTLLWRRRPGLLQAGAAGLLLALAALTKANGIVIPVPALIAVVCLRWGDARPDLGRVRRFLARFPVAAAATLLLAFATPVVAYATWFHSDHGTFSITTGGGRYLYARVAPFADCSKFSVPANERFLCPTQPVGKRPTLYGSSVEWYMWSPYSPIYRLYSTKAESRIGGDFARRVIAAQPLTYLGTVAHDFIRSFAPIRTRFHGELPIWRWQFQTRYPVYFSGEANLVTSYGDGPPRVDSGLARFLRDYQRFGFTPGPLLALGLVAGLLAALGLGRARGSGLRTAAFLFAATGAVVFGSTVVANQFTWRYQVPQIVLFPAAAALGLTALRRRRRAPEDEPEPWVSQARLLAAERSQEKPGMSRAPSEANEPGSPETPDSDRSPVALRPEPPSTTG